MAERLRSILRRIEYFFKIFVRKEIEYWFSLSLLTKQLGKKVLKPLKRDVSNTILINI